MKAYLTPFSIAVFVMIYPLRGGDTLGLGFLPSLAALALLGVAFATRPKGRFVFTATDIAVIVYFFIIIVSMLISGVSDMSLRYFTQIVILSIIPFVIIRIAGLSIDDVMRFIRVFPYVALLSAASMIIIIGPTQLISYSGSRLGTEAFNPVGVGYAFGISAFASVVALKLRLCSFVIAGLSTFVSVAILLLTGSRGSMLALVAVLVLLLLANARRNLNWRIALMVLVIAVTVYFVFDTVDSTMVFDRYTNALDSYSVQARYESWKIAIDMFQEQLLLGHGLGTFEAKHGEYAHNVVLEHMANGGLILTIPFLVIALRNVGWVFAGALGRSNEVVVILALLAIYAFAVRLFSFSMANTKEVFLFLAMAMSCAQSLRRTQA